MLLEKWVEIDIMVSLLVILGVLIVSVVASLIWTKHERGAEATKPITAESQRRGETQSNP
jgi:hypothetical protein